MRINDDRDEFDDIEGGKGRGLPPPEHRERPSVDAGEDEPELRDTDLGFEEDDPADRRKDPLRR